MAGEAGGHSVRSACVAKEWGQGSAAKAGSAPPLGQAPGAACLVLGCAAGLDSPYST